MDKLSMQSVDGVAANIDIIARHFPSCITEARDPEGQLVRGIDFEKLKAELSSSCIPDKAERYQFTWPGKMDAARLANQPSAATLRPCREESVDFDTTSNLYIEGDNLEVLKVLRNTYAGKVKMIYIDPPYNTGKDFVYEDNFTMDSDDFLLQSGQLGASGERMVVNSDTNGRFHTDWLNMIYPRLKLARELLRDDGVAFISIDDNEQDNLKKICCEVFGDSNFIAQIVVKRTGGRQDSSFFAVHHEYILCFARDKTNFEAGTESYERSGFNLFDPVKGKKYKTQLLRKWGDNSRRTDRPNLYYPIPGPNGEDIYPTIYMSSSDDEGNLNHIEGCWRWKKEVMTDALAAGLIEFKKDRWGNIIPYERIYESDTKNFKLYSTWIEKSVSGSSALKGLFELSPFNYPKSVDLICHLLKMANLQSDDIVLDFFSGSSSTAQAVISSNVEDSGCRKFIMVQIPELTDKTSEAFKAGYKTICEIGKERIRRAGAAIKAESGLMAGDLDTGFRVLKLDSSNMKDVYYSADEVSLGGFSEFNIKDDRSGEDLLFQVMLDLGIELSSSIEVRNLAGHTVYVVDGGYLVACFDDRVSAEAARAIAGLNPHWFVMCDAAFGSDADADNIMQVFKAVSPMSQIRVI